MKLHVEQVLDDQGDRDQESGLHDGHREAEGDQPPHVGEQAAVAAQIHR
jgi:hypothetical protein